MTLNLAIADHHVDLWAGDGYNMLWDDRKTAAK